MRMKCYYHAARDDNCQFIALDCFEDHDSLHLCICALMHMFALPFVHLCICAIGFYGILK